MTVTVVFVFSMHLVCNVDSVKFYYDTLKLILQCIVEVQYVSHHNLS